MSAAGAVALWVVAVAALVGLSWWLPRPHGLGHAAVRTRALLVVAGALVAIVAGALLMPR
ncbi:hypothetical protein Q9R32_17275 [Actinotalea sp. AC32]|nr:hypothetical protein [Actinotalea sp. AC32]